MNGKKNNLFQKKLSATEGLGLKETQNQELLFSEISKNHQRKFLLNVLLSPKISTFLKLEEIEKNSLLFSNNSSNKCCFKNGGLFDDFYLN